METNSSAFHLTAVAMLAQSDKLTSISVSDATLEDIQEAVKLFGGNVYVTPSESEHHSIYSQSKIGNCHLWFHHHTTNLVSYLQRESFQSKESIFEEGTDLTIIDNQYFVLFPSNNTK
jgi:hypothetical protein